MSQISEIKPFNISIPESRLHRLKQKLALTDFPSQLESDASELWTRGPPLQEIKELTEYWLNSHDWRKAEASLNQNFPQFITTINANGFGDYNVHFIHARSNSDNAIPLLFLHGWPGSFYEGTKIVHLLSQSHGDDGLEFNVVVPSLIDHGFSSGSRTKDFHLDQHAEVYHKLMLKLGYTKYVAQGGDTGYLISRFLAQMYPESCLAHHINMSIPNEPSPDKTPDLYKMWTEQGGYAGLSDKEKLQLERGNRFKTEGSGYFAIHSTRPLALGFAMTDSPVGLLAWIYDKLHEWTDNYSWTRDEILTWVSIYYFSSAGPASSFNTYFTNQHRQPLSAFQQAVEWSSVPLGISRFEKEIINMPKLWNQSLSSSLLIEKEHPVGGHFAAFEQPQLLVDDIKQMFREHPEVLK